MQSGDEFGNQDMLITEVTSEHFLHVSLSYSATSTDAGQLSPSCNTLIAMISSG